MPNTSEMLDALETKAINNLVVKVDAEELEVLIDLARQATGLAIELARERERVKAWKAAAESLETASTFKAWHHSHTEAVQALAKARALKEATDAKD